ncbi:tRNA-uridine aminocarboxypropyltransferase [Salinibius halmophilus]|uniref:tRNA-uridine aminocarboxypropyltransferase n=1 Tax=Salinibius halmophilus TaxID=1853216 RepID=UPI000E66E000|nr:tRNA-uridine aminocarboxypropyltransferase [Salinibius halmophilus]
MQFWRLIHQRELERPTNTGRLIPDAIPIIWQRKVPNPALLAQIEQGNMALLYPGDSTGGTQANIEHCLIIDATWQEAQKIYNQSAYLHSMPRISLEGYTSTYRLRRNQRGLCTAEAAAYVLIEEGNEQAGQTLLQRLQQWQEND